MKNILEISLAGCSTLTHSSSFFINSKPVEYFMIFFRPTPPWQLSK